MHRETTPRFETLELLLEAIELLRPVVMRIRRYDKELADQIRDALNSAALNLAEGNGCEGGHRLQRFGTASGSNREARTGLRLAVAWGYVTRADVEPGDTRLDRVGGMIHGLRTR